MKELGTSRSGAFPSKILSIDRSSSKGASRVTLSCLGRGPPTFSIGRNEEKEKLLCRFFLTLNDRV